MKLIIAALKISRRVHCDLYEGGEGDGEEKDSYLYNILRPAGSARSHRNRRTNLTYDHEDEDGATREKETIAWEAIGIARILVGRGNEDEVPADLCEKFCERVRVNCEKQVARTRDDISILFIR